MEKVKLMKSTEELVIRFAGENDIDLNTLTQSLNSTVNALKIIADNTLGENDFCKFKVRNIEKGSFVVVIQSLYELAPAILPHLPTVLTTFKTVLDIKKHLNGKPPKEIKKVGDECVIVNNYGVINHYSYDGANIYFKNNDLDKNISDIAKINENDTSRNGVAFEIIKEDSRELIEFSGENLKNAATHLDVEKFDENSRSEEIEVNILVYKPDLNGNTKWGVYLHGDKIKIDMLDSNFLQLIHDKAIYFMANTSLKVRMQVQYKVLGNGLPDENSKPVRSVIKVYEVEQDGEMIKI